MTNQTTGQRTPGPWKVRYEKSRDRFVLSGTHDNIGDFGCFKGYEVDGVTGEGEDAANAAFIVRACNNHDALVGALQGYKDMTDNILARKEFSNNDFETMKTALTFILPQTVKTLTAATKET